MNHLLNALPCSSRNDCLNCGVVNTVVLGYALDPMPPNTLAVSETNGANIILGELCGPNTITKWTILTTLSVHIPDVIKLRSGEKVGRVTARRVVATVKNLHRTRERTCTKEVCDPVSGVHISTIDWFGKTHNAVPMTIACSTPFPALVRATAVHLQPKAFNLFWGKIKTHSRLLFSGAIPRLCPAARGLFVPQLYHRIGGH